MLDQSYQSYSSNIAAAASQSTKERDYWLEKLPADLQKSVFPYDNKKTVKSRGEVKQVETRIGGQLFSRLLQISNKSDPRLLMLLVGGLNLLLNKYTDNNDIILCMPIYKQKAGGDFINTVLPLRCQLYRSMAFKELLYQLKQTISEAVAHQNYPLRALLYDLNLTYSEEDFPLFDVVVILENIQDKKYIQHIHTNITFLFLRTGECLKVLVEYNGSRYNRETIERIIAHFTHLMQQAMVDVNVPLSQLDCLSPEEKTYLLEGLNNTKKEDENWRDKTLHRLFEDQVEKNPGNIALMYEDKTVTYTEFNRNANRLARVLKEKGINTGNLVALLMESSIDMVVAVMAVLKAGGSYLPIDREIPNERKKYILEDSQVPLVISDDNGEPASLVIPGGIETVNACDENIYARVDDGSNLGALNQPGDLAYIIYTSGSTGNPKGVMVEHRQVVNTLVYRKQEYRMTSENCALNLFSYAFDGFITSFFTPIISGARVVLLSKQSIEDMTKIIEAIYTNRVTHLISVPILYQVLVTNMTEEQALSLQVVTLAGDKLPAHLVKITAAKNKDIEIVNEYGITEAAVMSTVYRHQERTPHIKIGHPIWNNAIYITQPGNPYQLKPMGVDGEMCIAGKGIARGYMNVPELTAERFTDNPFAPGQRLLKTGDMAKWLTDRNIEFGGRIDFQVKIRGFRIELAEIERYLLNHEEIKECVVLANDTGSGDKYLCAYIVSLRELGVTELREYLSTGLPEYMIPAYFVHLDCLPLSTNGKINRKALPAPDVSAAAEEYVAPRNDIERKLVEIWAETLGIEKDSISIEANFFELGGHSLTATILANQIHKELNTKIPMIEIFKSPYIKHMAEYIRAEVEEIFISINLAEEKEYYPLSSAQNRLYILHQMDFGATAYNIPLVVELLGELGKQKLENAFRKLIQRHEGLRTSFKMLEKNPVQRVHQPSEIKFAVEYYQLEKDNDHLEEAVNDILAEFINPFDLSQPPLIRVKLIKINPSKHILMVDMHHIITDIVAYGILTNNFLLLYNGRDLSPLKLQYKDYSQWLRCKKVEDLLKKQEEFWLQEFRGEIPILNLPTDFPRPALQSFAGSTVTFEISKEQTKALAEMALTEGGTLFMAVLTVFNIFLFKISNQNNIIVGTPTVDRKHSDLENIIGIFLNMLALKNYPQEKMTFIEFLRNIKERTLTAFENQDYPFEELVERVELERDISRNPLFDVTIMYQNMLDTARENEEQALEGLTIRPYPFKNKSSKYDLTLGTMELREHLSFTFEYCTKLFKDETIFRFIKYFKNVISSVIINPRKKISQIEILPGEEKKKILEDFNDTNSGYHKDKTIHQLFEEQAEKTPDRIAPAFEDQSLTYYELEKKANQVANYLYPGINIQRGERVGILMDRSLNIIPVILAILKAGGAYVPIDSSLPGTRIKYIINDADIGVIISEKGHIKILNRLQWECQTFHTYLCMDSTSVYEEDEREKNDLMDQEMWHYIGESAGDEITGGGWISSYTGEPFTNKEMEEYSNNIFRKLVPFLNQDMRVLEIGCASGITIYRIAPHVGFYYGTDLSNVIIEKNKKRIKEEAHRNIALSCLPAHEIDKLDEGNFDIIILNSVIHYFHGHNYLRKVLYKAIDKLGEKGYLFLGDLMDQDLKEHLAREMKNFKRANRNKNYRTKVDWDAELFVSRGFLEDFALTVPAIQTIEFSNKIYTVENELTKFRYDALITIDKSRKKTNPNKTRAPGKHQHDLSMLNKSGYEKATLPGNQRVQPDDLAYVMYTSGTTGVPKGIMIEHRPVINFIKGITDLIEFSERDCILSLTTISFDIFGLESILPITKGSKVIIGNRDEQFDNIALTNAINKQDVSIFQLTPSRLQILFSDDDSAGKLKSLKCLLVGGEALPEVLLHKARRLISGEIYNLYGPTETTIWSTTKDVSGKNPLNIGQPIANTKIYILNKNQQLTSIGTAGELCIGGDGLARGYLNNIKLTAEKFTNNPFICGKRIYGTGDLARWLTDGDIEFLGRIDHQVKIRGFRIELAEIEIKLMEIEYVKKAVVIERKEENGGAYLCAYMISPQKIVASETRNELSNSLPDYMIPSYFMQIEKISLTPNGKLDRKALPDPVIQEEAGYIKPRNRIEETLAEIWSEELALEKVSIDSNFFQLGGHSLKATTIIAKVHRELNAKLSMLDMFKTPTIRGLAKIIAGANKEKYEAIAPGEKKEYYILSSAQKRLYIIQQRDLDSTTYNMTQIFISEIEPVKEKLHTAFTKLIQRHESLKTSFELLDGEPVQRIYEQVEFDIGYRDFESNDKEESPGDSPEEIIKHFVKPFDLSQAPLLRAGLLKTGGGRIIWMIDMHHIISDAVSNNILIRDFFMIYSDQQLPRLKLHYKDFTQWQNKLFESGKIKKQETFWLKEFEKEIPLLDLPLDFPRPPSQSFDGGSIGFELKQKEVAGLKELAVNKDTTLFVVILAIYYVLLAKLSGQHDIVVGTGIAGRRHADLQHIIGMLVNTLALRNYPTKEKTFSEFVSELKEKTLLAFENQDYLFENLVEKVVATRQWNRNPLFDTALVMMNREMSSADITSSDSNQLNMTRCEFEANISKFDLSLYCWEGDQSMQLIFEYASKLFKKESIERFIIYFKEILSQVIEHHDIQLKDITTSFHLSDAESVNPEMELEF